MSNNGSRKRKTRCEICNVFCRSGPKFFNHVIGHEHRVNLGCVSPECLPYIDRLQYVFDTYMKQEAFVGLEYIEEKKEGNKYLYKCLLCDYQGQMMPIFLHIIGPDHMAEYIKKHHPNLCVLSRSYFDKSAFVEAVRRAASGICKRFGRKTIKEVNADGSRGPPPQNMSNSDPKTESNVTPNIIRDVHTSSLQNLERKSSDHPATSDVCERISRKTMIEVNADGSRGPTPPKMSKSSSDPKAESNVTPDIIRDVRTSSLQNLEQKSSDHPAEVLEFTENGEFLDFLQKFEIRSEEDAWFIKQITQNCTQELERFQEEQTQQNQVPGAPPAPANETGKGSSVSATGAGKVAPAPELQTYGLELFFNSIKNMEGSEVGTILQEVAATNPAFRGIDIPSVIKYLQATGRIKTA